MTHTQAFRDDEPVLPDSYLRRGPATSGELFVLDQWRRERRMRDKPAARFFDRVAPFLGLGAVVAVSWLSRDVAKTMFGLLALVMALGSRYQRNGYIRLLERYANELGELRARVNSTSA